jgi:uncharacterized protein YbbK (DUF523 family)
LAIAENTDVATTKVRSPSCGNTRVVSHESNWAPNAVVSKSAVFLDLTRKLTKNAKNIAAAAKDMAAVTNTVSIYERYEPESCGIRA